MIYVSCVSALCVATVPIAHLLTVAHDELSKQDNCSSLAEDDHVMTHEEGNIVLVLSTGASDDNLCDKDSLC